MPACLNVCAGLKVRKVNAANRVVVIFNVDLRRRKFLNEAGLFLHVKPDP